MSEPQPDEKKDGDGRINIGEHVVIYPRGKRRTWTADFNFVAADGRRRHGRRSRGTRVRRNAEAKAWDLDRELAAGELKPKAEPPPPSRSTPPSPRSSILSGPTGSPASPW